MSLELQQALNGLESSRNHYEINGRSVKPKRGSSITLPSAMPQHGKACDDVLSWERQEESLKRSTKKDKPVPKGRKPQNPRQASARVLSTLEHTWIRNSKSTSRTSGPENVRSSTRSSPRRTRRASIAGPAPAPRGDAVDLTSGRTAASQPKAVIMKKSETSGLPRTPPQAKKESLGRTRRASLRRTRRQTSPRRERRCSTSAIATAISEGNSKIHLDSPHSTLRARRRVSRANIRRYSTSFLATPNLDDDCEEQDVSETIVEEEQGDFGPIEPVDCIDSSPEVVKPKLNLEHIDATSRTTSSCTEEDCSSSTSGAQDMMSTFIPSSAMVTPHDIEPDTLVWVRSSTSTMHLELNVCGKVERQQDSPISSKKRSIFGVIARGKSRKHVMA